jgi:hypothetical protein
MESFPAENQANNALAAADVQDVSAFGLAANPMNALARSFRCGVRRVAVIMFINQVPVHK